MSLGEESIQVWAELGLVFAAQGEEKAALSLPAQCQRAVVARHSRRRRGRRRQIFTRVFYDFNTQS